MPLAVLENPMHLGATVCVVSTFYCTVPQYYCVKINELMLAFDCFEPLSDSTVWALVTTMLPTRSQKNEAKNYD